MNSLSLIYALLFAALGLAVPLDIEGASFLNELRRRDATIVLGRGHGAILERAYPSTANVDSQDTLGLFGLDEDEVVRRVILELLRRDYHHTLLGRGPDDSEEARESHPPQNIEKRGDAGVTEPRNPYLTALTQPYSSPAAPKLTTTDTYVPSSQQLLVPPSKSGPSIMVIPPLPVPGESPLVSPPPKVKLHQPVTPVMQRLYDMQHQSNLVHGLLRWRGQARTSGRTQVQAGNRASSAGGRPSPPRSGTSRSKSPARRPVRGAENTPSI